MSPRTLTVTPSEVSPTSAFRLHPRTTHLVGYRGAAYKLVCIVSQHHSEEAALRSKRGPFRLQANLNVYEVKR